MTIVLKAWIFKGTWMWHVNINDCNDWMLSHICWGRGRDPDLELFDFAYCPTKEHE